MKSTAVSVRSVVDPFIYDCLKNKIGMSNKEIQNNIELIVTLQKLDLQAFQIFMNRNIPDILRADHPKSYIVGAMKKYLDNSVKKESVQRRNETTSIGNLFGNIIK